VLDLVQRFQEQQDDYLRPDKNETETRRELIDPLFAALGWDIDNRQGHAEAYKDVVHEDKLKIGSDHTAPDYCFRVGGTRKFFLEAKKPAVKIHTDGVAAYQLRRYAWSAKLPLSILTDFEELAVYDTRIKPHEKDKASVARVMYLHYAVGVELVPQPYPGCAEYRDPGLRD
jgi:predicted type IV restriction endonuclease